MNDCVNCAHSYWAHDVLPGGGDACNKCGCQRFSDEETTDINRKSFTPKRKIHARNDLFMPEACEKCGHPVTNRSFNEKSLCIMCLEQNAIDDAAQGLKDLVKELEAS